MAVGLLLVGFLGFAQEYDIYKDAPESVKERIAKADELISKKQYASANGALGVDDNEYIIYKRTEIYTQYFVQSLMHQMFVLKDLEKNEDLMELRQNLTGDYPMIMYNVEEVIENFQDENGKKPILYLALGNYYYDVANRYGDQWLITLDELINNAKVNYKKAETAGFYDTYSLFNMGSMEISESKWPEAEAHYAKLVTMEEDNPSAWYNLALTYMYQGKYADASEPCRKAIACEKNPAWMVDEYVLLSDSYVYSGNTDEAIKALTEGKKKCKDDSSIPVELGKIYYSYNDDYAKAEKEFLAAVRLEPTAVSDVINLLGNSQDWDNFIGFCKKALKLNTKDDEYLGFVEYMLSQGYIITGDYKNCLAELKKAENYLTKAGVFEDYQDAVVEMREVCEEILSE